MSVQRFRSTLLRIDSAPKRLPHGQRDRPGAVRTRLDFGKLNLRDPP